jgi:very-short-patch-repair endonuclease
LATFSGTVAIEWLRIGDMAVPVREYRALNTRRPFSRADARRAGIGLRELLSPRFHKIFYDCYVASTVPITTELRADAALGISPTGSYVSHFTAAQLWGAVVPDVSDVHLTVPGQAGRTVRRGVKAHAAAEGTATTRLNALPITTPPQTFLDLAAAGLDLVALVVLGDSLIKSCRTTARQLAEAAIAWRGRGAKVARRAAGYVRDSVDSVTESRLRMLLVLAGLPEPRVNFIMRHPDGSWRMRFDLCYPALKLIIEYDGRQHAMNSAQWQRDLRRREELDALGWRLIVVTAADLFDAPQQVLARVQAALIERGATGIRRQFKTEWIRYFTAS